MKKNTIIIILILFLSLFVFKNFESKDLNYKKSKIVEQIDKESKHPFLFLEYKIQTEKRFLHNGYKIYFTIKNTAKNTIYKDFEIIINSIGNSQTLIKKEKAILYETIKPNQTLKIVYKTKNISKKYKIEIESIKPLINE